MAEFNLKRKAGLKVTLPVEGKHRLVLHAKLPVHFIEIPDIHFNHGSPVVCLDAGEGLIHGLSHAFYHAKENPGQEMVIVGHADTSGEPEVNYPLSELRALGVKAILTGNREDWKKVVRKAKVEDYQLTLKSMNALYFWDCDPGAVDDKEGPKTRRAVRGFQKEANSIFGLGLADDGIMGEKTWLAMLDVLRFLLAQGGVDLNHDYPFLQSLNGIYACGESFPVQDAGNKNLVSKENRRVEIYFGPAGELKPLDPPSSPKSDLTPGECVLFDPDARTLIPFGLKSSIAVRHVDVNGDPIPGATAKLLKADGSQVDAPKATDTGGFVFWFGIEAGEYTVDFADA